MINSSAFLVWGVLGLSVVTIVGCAERTRPKPPPDVAARVEKLTAVLRGERPPDVHVNAYWAAVELGEIGLRYRLPRSAIEALEAAKSDDMQGFEEAYFADIGSGTIWYREGDGARIAFWMWELRDIKSDVERVELLWRKFAGPNSTPGIRKFCVEELGLMKWEGAAPYLLAAAAKNGDRDWHVRRRATLGLASLYPESQDMLLLLTHSPDSAVAQFAREALDAKGNPYEGLFPYPFGEEEGH